MHGVKLSASMFSQLIAALPQTQLISVDAAQTMTSRSGPDEQKCKEWSQNIRARLQTLAGKGASCAINIEEDTGCNIAHGKDHELCNSPVAGTRTSAGVDHDHGEFQKHSGIGAVKCMHAAGAAEQYALDVSGCNLGTVFLHELKALADSVATGHIVSEAV